MPHLHKYAMRMRALLENFNLEEAQKLSQEIHDAEAADYLVCDIEEQLWLRLTTEIERVTKTTKQEEPCTTSQPSTESAQQEK